MKPKNIFNNYKLAVCCLARDCAKRLKKNIRRLERLAKYFEQVDYFVVENNSKDNTRAILEQWHTHNTHVHLPDVYAYKNTLKNIDIDFDRSQDFKQEESIFKNRIMRISLARDCYLDAIAHFNKQFNGAHYKPDFILMLDIDVLNFSLAGVLESFRNTQEWDMISANGRKYELYRTPPYIKNIYYDSYALEQLDKPSKPYDWKFELQEAFAKLQPKQDLVRVASAFGGMTLYKFSTLYEDEVEVELASDVSNMTRPITNNTYKPRATYLKAIAQDNYNFCEHISFHNMLRTQGKDKMFINPNMLLYYNSIFHALARVFLGHKGK